MSIVKEFRDFAVSGNVMDMAIGVVIGGVFNPIAKSLVDDVIMPPIGLLLGRVDFKNLYFLLKSGAALPGPYDSLEAAKAAGAVTINYGNFINLVLTFLITAIVIFIMVRVMNKWRKQEEQPAEAAS